MSTFKFTNVKSGDTLDLTYAITSLGVPKTKVVDQILSSGISGTFNSDGTAFTVSSITENSVISVTVDKVLDPSTLELGSEFTLGKYQVASETPWKIPWSIVHQESDYQIAMATEILDMRCFDAKEANNTDSNRQNYGNNNYKLSNIGLWLNSTASAGSWYTAQHDADAPPSSANVWNGWNSYDTKAGFLNLWTEDELAYLQTITLTLANNTATDGGGSYTISTKVFLPTYTQMGFGTNNSISEGTAFSVFTDTTSRIRTIGAMCAANNPYCISNSKTAGTAWYYWMSSAYPSFSYSARYVHSGGSDSYYNAYYGNRGVVPCIMLSR